MITLKWHFTIILISDCKAGTDEITYFPKKVNFSSSYIATVSNFSAAPCKISQIITEFFKLRSYAKSLNQYCKRVNI